MTHAEHFNFVEMLNKTLLSFNVEKDRRNKAEIAISLYSSIRGQLTEKTQELGDRFFEEIVSGKNPLMAYRLVMLISSDKNIVDAQRKLAGLHRTPIVYYDVAEE